MYLKRIPRFIQSRLSRAIWSLPGNGVVYLTFDDGPSSRTSELISLLDEYHVKASHFLLGKQVELYPGITKELTTRRHAIGNHGYEHLSGWSTKTEEYLGNHARGKQHTQSNLYRPPYGKMTPDQWRRLPSEDHIVMWSIMPGDFQEERSDDMCIRTVTDNLHDGAIIVLHDNERTIGRVLRILPEIIRGIKEKGFRMEALSLFHSDEFNT